MKALAADDPRVIGEYRLRAQLGAGGMGQVYLGLSPAGRAVAIKVLRPDLATDTGFLRRFAQEVASARAVSGIYTAPVVASGLNERPPWLATAFVPGPSLDQVVSEHGPLPEPALWPLLGGLVEALQAIHACGVVHRDLKPANVLLAADGPRVIDFGISRAAGGTALTATGLVFGTPGYMSPEQAEGKPAGPASDVFALGCVIAFAAAGAGPFGSGTAAAVIYRVVHAEAALDRVPSPLREIVSACLAKDPAARPEPRALAAAMVGRAQGTGPSAVAFWPRSVASFIAAYQATLEQETRAPDQATTDSPRAAGLHPPTDLWSQGNGRGGQGSGGPVASGSGWPPQPPLQAYPSSQGYPNAQGYPGLQGPAESQGSAGLQGPAGSQGSPGLQGPAESQGSPGSQGPAYAQGYNPAKGYPQPQGYSQPQGYPQPQGYSQPQGYFEPQGYSQPQGYGGARASQPRPRGYDPGADPAGYPQPYRAGRAAVAPLPASVLNAVRLMYAGAAYAGVYAIGVIVVASAIIKDHPALAAARAGSGHTTLAGVAILTILASAVEVGLWLGIAQACRNGQNWARVTGTVLFGLHTLGVLAVLANSHPGIGLTKLLTLVGWLIACGAVVFLWQRQSSAFFTATAPGR